MRGYPLGDEWRWWSEVAIRGAGFPAGEVRRLADTALAELADALPGDLNGPQWTDFRAMFDKSMTESGHQLRLVAAGSRFQTAVAWQNHQVVDRAVRPLLRARPDAPRNAKHRQREELVASYWQRYCVKNDTIGFFGPVGWGRMTGAPATTFAPGPELVRGARAYFETWAIDKLAEVIGADPAMRPWLVPRRLPYVRLDGDTLVQPTAPPARLSTMELHVLRACDGATPAGRIAAGAPGTAAQVMASLDQMCQRRWIAWRLDIPATPYPERDLRAFLRGVGDPVPRERWLARLDALEAARAAVPVSPDAEPQDVIGALAELDARFVALTEQSATRNAGQTYGARTLVYQDACRDMSLAIGHDLRVAAAPLELLALAARWVSWRVAERLRPRLGQVYRRLAGPGGRVDLATFWFEASLTAVGTVREALADLRVELAGTWDRLLGAPGDARVVTRRLDDLLPGARAAFAAPGPGWAAARYVSPDLMVAARDADALAAGDFRLVLGEAHMAVNTQRSNHFVTQHPDPAALLRQVDEDFPAPRLLPALPKDGPLGLPIRTMPGLVRDGDLIVEFNHHSVAADRPGLVLGGDATVAEVDGELVVVLPSGATFDILDVFAELLMDEVKDELRLYPDAPHAPRVVVDRLVVARETWRFDPADLDWAAEPDEARRFVRARRFQARHGLPRHVFVKAAAGEKPVFIDFDSPLSATILARIVRRAAQADPPVRLTVVEMLPGFDDLWLADADGRRYTSELRLTLVDHLGPPGGPTRAPA